jgi:hypothetical protein
MSRMLFGNIVRAENFKVVSIPTDMLWCLGPWAPISGDTQGRDHSEGVDRIDSEDLLEVKH